jgi:hypothetical protein
VRRPRTPGTAGAHPRRAVVATILLCLVAGVACGVYGKPVRSTTAVVAPEATPGAVETPEAAEPDDGGENR